MTKILLITNKQDYTTDFVVKRLKKTEVDFYRLNTEEIGQSCFITLDFLKNAFRLYDKNLNQEFDLLSFTSVYFRRPELPEVPSEGLTPEEQMFVKAEHNQFLEGLYKLLRNAYWISPIDAIKRAENKIYQLSLAQELGFAIPESLITNEAADFRKFCHDKECIVKPIMSGQIGWPEMHEVVFTSSLEHTPDDEEIASCPSYLQRQIEKVYDIRLTIVGQKAFAVAIDSQINAETRIDWRKGENLLPHRKIELPHSLIRKCQKMLSVLELQYGAFDFILDKFGNHYFLEVNPNGQWAWIECQTGYDISGAIVNQLIKGSYDKCI
ncbi:MAG: MvdC/MvdD family ATP grasp protein [Prevotella sp.]